MTDDKRFTTVELLEPNRWGIWYDGAYLSTYQVCILLNEYVDVKNENEQLKSFVKRLTNNCGEIVLMNGMAYNVKKALGDLND